MAVRVGRLHRAFNIGADSRQLTVRTLSKHRYYGMRAGCPPRAFRFRRPFLVTLLDEQKSNNIFDGLRLLFRPCAVRTFVMTDKEL